MTSSTNFFFLIVFVVEAVNGIPVTQPSLYVKDFNQELTTTSPVPSLESKIKTATETIKVLSQKVEDSLAETIVADASQPTSGITDLPEESLAYAADSVTASVPVVAPIQSSQSNQTSPQSPVAQDTENVIRDQKFSTVLKDLDDLEYILQGGIRNFTRNHQYAYSAMLRPMLTQIQQLKNNLTNLRNRMIGFVALTELRQQVTDLTVEIGDAITSNQKIPGQRPPPLANSVADEQEDLKLLQDALGWVNE